MPKHDAHPATTPIALIQDRYDRAEVFIRPMR